MATLIVYGIMALGVFAALGGFILHERNIGETKGEAKIQKEWDADKQARIKAFSDMRQKWVDAQVDGDKAAKERDAARAQMATVAKQRRSTLPTAVADTRVPDVGGLLNDVFVPNPTAAAGSTGGTKTNPAAGAVGADTSVGLWVDWSIAMKDLYTACRDEVVGWQKFYQSLRDKQGKQEGKS